jgi:SET domain-containing protein
MDKYFIHNDMDSGRKCISCKEIKRGEIILMEKPFLIWNKKIKLDETTKKQLKSINKLMNLAPFTKYTNITLSNIKSYTKTIYNKIKTNAFTYRGKLMNRNISCLLYFGSFFNHSCDSNIHYYQRFGKFYFVAIKDISIGEELCISYINGYNKDLMSRQEKLMNWNFICDCKKCNHDKLQIINKTIEDLSKIENPTIETINNIHEYYYCKLN